MYILEYIWLDSENNFRSKTRVSKKFMETWNYDGSSTGQATTEKSEIILRPVFKCLNPFKYVNGYECWLVLCDLWINDHTPHESNTRLFAQEIFEKHKHEKPLFGLEQEFFIERPELTEADQNFYCKNNFKHGREVVEEAFDKCLRAELNMTGLNAEVAPHQWEFQVCDYSIGASDQLLMARYIFQRHLESKNYKFILSPKPLKHCNGSGCHINFSTAEIRNGNYEIEYIMEKFEKNHKNHLKVYGKRNETRLTGKNETSSANKFTWGIGDRTASIRCNVGYFEDRRPGSNIDPYIATATILETLLS